MLLLRTEYCRRDADGDGELDLEADGHRKVQFYNVVAGDLTVDGQEFIMYSEREQDGCLSFTCNVCKKEFECKVSIK